MKFIPLLVISFLFTACVPAVRFSSLSTGVVVPKNSKIQSGPTEKIPTGTIYHGIASYYGTEFNGRQTSNGEIYDMNKLTAAHRELPFGTMIKVTNVANRRWVVVRVNDRGPFVAGRILDLSYEAARQLDMVRTGTAEVEIEVVE